MPIRTAGGGASSRPEGNDPLTNRPDIRQQPVPDIKRSSLANGEETIYGLITRKFDLACRIFTAV